MKKFLSLSVVITMIITLSACTSLGYVQQEDYDNCLYQKDELQEVNDSNLELIEQLEGRILEDYFTLQVGDTVKEVYFEEGSENTFFDLIKEEFSFNYSTSEWGTFVNSANELVPLNGQYLALYHNSELSSEGVDTVSFSDEDTFEFKLVWWDTAKQDLYHSLEVFIEYQASSFVNASSIDYNVLMGLSELGIVNDFVSQEEVVAYVDNLDLVTATDYYKAIMMLEAVGAESSDLQEELVLIATVGGYGATYYNVAALEDVSYSDDYLSFLESVNTSLIDYDTANIDLDTFSVEARLFPLFGLDNALYIDVVTTLQLESGGFKSSDSEWDGTVYPGSENAATMAQVLLTLIVLENTSLTDSLVARMLDYQLEDGSFIWTIDSKYADFAFSTPQAFRALATYHGSIN